MAAGRRTDWLAPFRHPIFAAVLVWEFVSFWIAFISQAVIEAKAHVGIDVNSSGSPVGVLWFAIFLQLALLAATYYTLATGTLAIHRSLLAVFTAVGLVFSVIGTDKGIYGNLVKPGASKALGVGWLFLCFINIFWLFIFGADETNAVFARVVYFGNTEHFMSARPRATHTFRAESAQNMTGGISSTQYQTGGVGGGGFNSKGRTSDVSFVSAGSLANQDPYAPVKRSSPPRSLHNAPAVQQPLMGALLEESPVKEERSPVAQAKALYAYTANPDDPSELSFGKGEMLDIFDKSGKWWQAKKPDGTIGIIPSNYVRQVDL